MESPFLINLMKNGSLVHKLHPKPADPLQPLHLKTPNGQPFRVTQMVQFKSLQLLPQEQQDEIFLASVKPGDFVELPTYIFVETRFMTKHSGEFADLAAEFEAMELAAMSQEVPSLNIATPETVATFKQGQCPAVNKDTCINLPQHKTFVDVGVSAIVLQNESSTETENPTPIRSRFQQTDLPQQQNVGIQCCLEMEVDFGYDVNDDLTRTINVVDKTNGPIFIDFVKKNASPYPNGRVECRLCGEVQLNMKNMESHLALHYGPKALCYRCGVQFENKIDLRHHICDAKKLKMSLRLHCPYYRCSLVAISQLELFDHINEHCSDDCYKCKSCGNAYPTVKELQKHAELRRKCSRTKPCFPYNRQRLESTHSKVHRLRVNVIYKLDGHKALRVSRLDKCSIKKCFLQCPVCLKVCSNEFKYRNHRKRCLSYYIDRLKRKLTKE